MVVNQMDGIEIVIRVDSGGDEAPLEKKKIYQRLPNGEAESCDEIHVIDGEGEDDLYPAVCFAPVSLEPSIASRFVSNGETT